MKLDLSDVTLCAADSVNLALTRASFAVVDGAVQIRRGSAFFARTDGWRLSYCRRSSTELAMQVCHGIEQLYAHMRKHVSVDNATAALRVDLK